jgi:hypothetical protein
MSPIKENRNPFVRVRLLLILVGLNCLELQLLWYALYIQG